MTTTLNRYSGPAATTAEGWSATRLTPPSRLYGANGIRTASDGRIWVAQVPGSLVSAVDPDSGAVEVISPMGGAIIAPDDLVFDEAGNLYCTEITEGRVCMRAPNGTVTVIQGDIPVANPITYHEGRLIVGECRIGARIMELDRNGGAPRIIKGDVPMANAFDVGPDGRLYAPIMGTNEIWAIDLETGAHQVIAGDLGVPDSVKFDSKGRIVTTQVMSGQVLRIDPVSGQREVLADLGPGLDNVTFVGDRIFVSSIPGELTEILAPGKTRSVIPRALQWPLGLAVGADGSVMVTDGAFSYSLNRSGGLDLAFMLFTHSSPGYARGVCAGSKAGEWIFTTGMGGVARYSPASGEIEWLANGYDQLMGVAAFGNAVIFAEYGTGRVLSAEGGAITELASGLDKPMGVAIGSDGTIYVAEAGADRVVKLSGGKSDTVLDGLHRTEGLCIQGGKLYAVDSVGKSLTECDLASGAITTVATQLPVGPPPGCGAMPFLGPIGDMSGPMINFAGIAAAPDGTLYLAADAEGSVMAIKPR
ncbi:gluconolaconase [Novosphingobium sp. AAP83]|uniref:Vgb family protein n=1 Tax=Novosphingobium sp. AAP83 TaxID=1523425 RepID=UPI0006B92564|nr:gluconolaconase [Novosphingobium sp. AAP83]KPF91839.1 gluconolaconase [Novosphingobium sp. AAP83]